MSYGLMKEMSCNKKSGTIKIKVTSNNVSPRTYRWNTFVECASVDDYYAELRKLAGYIYDGELQFLVGCRSHAHEAELKAFEAFAEKFHDLDRRWCEPGYEERKSFFVEEFVKALESPRDKSKYIFECHGHPCDVSYLSRGSGIYSISYRRSEEDDAQRVDYIKMKTITSLGTLEFRMGPVRFLAKKVA